MTIQAELTELINMLEDYLPPHLIEEVRGQILDIIESLS